MENGRLLERERTRAERLAILNGISRTISAVLDLEPLLQAIARECMRLLDLRFPLIGYRAANAGWITATGPRRSSATTTGIGRRPARLHRDATRTPLFVADYETACRAHGLTPGGVAGFAAAARVDRRADGRRGDVVGVLAGFIPAEHATAENAQLLSIMANQAAIAIENAHLYHNAQELRRRRGAQPPRPRDPRHDRAGTDRDDLPTRTGGYLPLHGAAETRPREGEIAPLARTDARQPRGGAPLRDGPAGGAPPERHAHRGVRAAGDAFTNDTGVAVERLHRR